MDKTFPKSEFTNYFLRINDIPPDSFKQWYFKPGMAFRDIMFWWKSHKQRKKPHEGIDLHYYTDGAENFVKLDHTNRFPLLFPGRIVKIFDDFQGKTVHVVHNIYGNKHNRLYSLYGHTKLLRVTNPGDYINESSAIISISTDAKGKVPPHLHITVFWAPEDITESIIDWDRINLMREIQLVDPVMILES